MDPTGSPAGGATRDGTLVGKVKFSRVPHEANNKTDADHSGIDYELLGGRRVYQFGLGTSVPPEAADQGNRRATTSEPGVVRTMASLRPSERMRQGRQHPRRHQLQPR